jgi:gliding motility-associated-like protein
MLSFNTRKPYSIAMKNKYLRFLIFSFLILRGGDLLAQYPADECDNARNISNPRNTCGQSATGGDTISTTRATISTLSGPSCFAGTRADVWLTFVAVATDIRFTVSNASGAALPNPQVVLYTTDDCMTFQDIGCRTGTGGSVELYKGGLFPGTRYYIRLMASSGTSLFRYCIVNYNPPASLSSDCPTATVLCDKSSFAVQSITGAGTNSKEAEDAACFGTSGVETNSTWFKWTCLQSGSLTFKITPLLITDDIDFVVYKLAGTVASCTGKVIQRCMAAGDESQPNTNPSNTNRRCWGATGLSETATDDSEPSGCSALVPHDNFVRALNMVAGESYALMINNYTSAGNGFSIDFGGTGSFQGPEAKVTLSKSSKRLCLGEDIVYSDASSSVTGSINKRQWRFGKGASIDSANGTGPYRVFYKTPGWKSIVLTVTTDRGCQVTTIVDSIFVEGFKYDSATRRPTCALGNDGMARLRVINCGRPPIRYNWDNAGYTTRDSITGLRTGTYRVAVTDSSGVYVDTIRFTLKEQTIDLDTAVRAVKSPLCAGMTNGSITLKPASGIGPYIYNWGRGNTLDSTLTALGAGSYNVSIRDANDCKGNFTFDLVDPPKMAVSVDTFNISCFGLTDGQLIAHPSGGVGNYRVSWSNGALGDTARNLKAGTYTCFAYDRNDCPAQMNVLVKEPTQIKLDTQRVKPSRCYGDSTAELVVRGFGGTPPYRYSIDGVRFQRDSAFLKIPARTYQVVVRDSTGCRATFTVPIPQPPVLQVNAGQDLDVDLGESKTLRAIVVPSSKLVNYAWTPADSTLSCKNCPVVTITALNSTIYRVTVKDSSNCTAYDDVLLRVIKRRPIYAPNVFSPNNDGINDFFTLYGNQAAVRIKSLRVFNRWGDMLFDGRDLPLGGDRLGWNGTFNGKDLPPDVFVYVAVVSFIDKEEIIIKGEVTLIR